MCRASAAETAIARGRCIGIPANVLQQRPSPSSLCRGRTIDAAESRFLEQVDDARLRDLYRYWDELRGERFAPAYAEVDPVAIPKLLPHLLVAEVETGPGGRRYRFRLCGTEVEANFGCAMGGRTVDELARGAYRKYMEGLYARLVDTGSALYSVSAYHDRSLQTKRLMLPLSSDGRSVDMVLSAQVFFRSSAAPQPLMAIQEDFEAEAERHDGDED